MSNSATVDLAVVVVAAYPFCLAAAYDEDPDHTATARGLEQKS